MRDGMRKKKKAGIAVGGLIIGILLLCGLDRADRKTTYIESIQINMQDSGTITVSDDEAAIDQEFKMPYELFTGMHIKVGTFGRNNNSFWSIELIEKSKEKIIYTWNFNASQVTDGSYYPLDADMPLRVNAGENYLISIKSENATGNSALAFYVSGEDTYSDGSLYLNGEEQKGDLCFQIYGAEKDGFWISLYAVLITGCIGMAYYLFRMRRRGEDIRTDRLFSAVCVGVIYMVLTYFFTRLNMGTFMDESDNIRGGILIAKGQVLYRDYYAQHTPFVYYLCALFALLGAASIEQFRILYFISNAVIWGGLYYRHSGYFGKTRMFFLPVIQVVVVMGMFFQGSKIMGDNIQGICMIALILEFLRYMEDKELGSSRCLIVAGSIFCSVMSAFVSVFALFPVIMGVIIIEIIYWKEKVDFSIKHLLMRYWRLALYIITPFVAVMIYFLWNDALGKMYRMAYQFNTIVYKEYQNQFGRVKWKPFVLGINNYFAVISDNFLSLVTASGSEIAVIQLLTAALAGIILVLWIIKGEKGKRIFPAVCLFLCMTGNATRSGMDFHGAAFYNLALTFIFILTTQWDFPVKNSRAYAVVTVLALYFIQPYISLISDHIVYKQEAISGIDKAVVDQTDPEDLIFIDAAVHDSIYLLYKQRYPANRNCYILPWYMDWFEYDTIEDLEEKLPAIAIYKPGREVYGETDFCPALDQAIQNLYTREGEDSILWKLK